MHFVDYHVRHGRQLGVDHQTTDEDTGCAKRQAGDSAGHPVGVDGVADHLPDVFATLLGDTVRQSCGESATATRTLNVMSVVVTCGCIVSYKTTSQMWSAAD